MTKAEMMKTGTAILAASAAFFLGGCGVPTAEHLDQGPSAVFTSLAGCAAVKGEAFCAKSYTAASERSSPVYDAQEDCVTVHGPVCASFQRYIDTSTTTYVPMGNGMMMPLIISSGYYKTAWTAPMVAWQALASDPKAAMPLFPTPQEGVVVRMDGKRLQLAS